jgi:hypothetical protein
MEHCGCKGVPGRRQPLYRKRNDRPSHPSSCSCPFYSNKGRKSRRPHQTTRAAESLLLRTDASGVSSFFIIAIRIVEVKIRLHLYSSCKVRVPTRLQVSALPSSYLCIGILSLSVKIEASRPSVLRFSKQFEHFCFVFHTEKNASSRQDGIRALGTLAT